MDFLIHINNIIVPFVHLLLRVAFFGNWDDRSAIMKLFQTYFQWLDSSQPIRNVSTIFVAQVTLLFLFIHTNIVRVHANDGQTAKLMTKLDNHLTN